MKFTSGTRKFILGWLSFSIVSTAFGILWHINFFYEEYKSFNLITAENVIIPLAISSMLLLGFISTYFFDRIYQPKNGYFEATKIALLVVLIPRMVVTLAFAAEQDVNGRVFDLIIFEVSLYSLIAIFWGLIMGEIYKNPEYSEL